MATLDQERAILAFGHIEYVKSLARERQKKYASMVHAMPALLRSAGLSQALHFVWSRKNEDQKQLLEHMAEQLKRVNSSISNGERLLDVVRTAELPSYLRLTGEALLVANWYRRFVQGELGIEAGEDNE